MGCHEADYTGAQNPTHEAEHSGTCEELSRDGQEMEARHVHSARLDGLCADRRACHDGLRPMPRRRTIHRHSDRLLVMPRTGLCWRNGSEPRGRGVPAQLRNLPQHRQLDGGNAGSQSDGLSADWRPCGDQLSLSVTSAGNTRARLRTAGRATRRTSRRRRATFKMAIHTTVRRVTRRRNGKARPLTMTTAAPAHGCAHSDDVHPVPQQRDLRRLAY